MQGQKTEQVVWRVEQGDVMRLTFSIWAGRDVPVTIRHLGKHQGEFCLGETESMLVKPLYANQPVDVSGICLKCQETISAKVEFVSPKTVSPKVISDFPHLCSAFEVEHGGRLDLCYQLNIPNKFPVLVHCPDCSESTIAEVHRLTSNREDRYEVYCRKCGKKLEFVANFWE